MSHAYAYPDFAAPAPVARPRPVVVIEPTPIAAPVSLLDRVGELLAAVLIITGGAALVALASLA